MNAVAGNAVERRHRRGFAAILGVAVCGLLLAACAGGDDGSSGPPAKRIVYDAVGASESAGYGADDPLTQAWPVVLSKTLPSQTVFHNYGIPGATVKDALAEELPKALADQPTLVTVWLNVNDMLALVSASTYEGQLDNLVHQLRRGGATKVLVANVPPLDHLPSYLACRPNPPPNGQPCTQRELGLIPPLVINSFVNNFNAAIARVVQKEGAILVDLHAAGLAARADGTEASMVGADGFHPSTAGHKAVAAAFEKALADSGGP